MAGERGTDDPALRLTEVCDVLGPLYRRILRTVERDAPIEGASAGVRAVLDMLQAHGPLTVPQMGRTQSLSRQFVQRMVHDATAQGWVRSQPNPAHKRSSLIALTAQGRRTITAITARERVALRRVGAGLRPGDVDACLRVLRAMLAGLDDIEEPD